MNCDCDEPTASSHNKKGVPPMNTKKQHYLKTAIDPQSLSRKCLLAGLSLLLSFTHLARSQDFTALSTYAGDGEGQDNSYIDFREAIGQEATSVLTFVDYTQAISTWHSSAGWSSGYLKNSPLLGNMVPIVSVGLADVPGGDTLTKMNAIAAGTYDGVFQNIVNVYKNKAYPKIYLRIGWEQNGAWYPWLATNNQTRANAYIAAWQRVANIAHATPGITVRTVWCPAVLNWSALSPNATYPGDAYVDVIAPDIYAKIWAVSGYIWPSGPALTPFDASEAGKANQAIWATTHANAMINRQHYWDYPGATQWAQTNGWGLRSAIYLAMTHNKPFGISECGTGGTADGVNGPLDGGDFPLYLANRLWYKVQRGLKIEFVNIWNKDVSDGKWKFSDGFQPRNAASWVTFVNTMAGATPNIRQVENIATVTSSDSITNVTDGAATGNYVPPVAPTGGDPTSKTEDTNLVTAAQIGGGAEILDANAINDYVQYMIPVNATGTYRVKVRVRKDSTRGQFQLSIAGGAPGPVQDLYSDVVPPGNPEHGAAVNYKYETLDLGTTTFTTTGSKAFKFTVSGKNIASSGFSLVFDYIHLSPFQGVTNPGFELDAPASQTITGWSKSGLNPTASYIANSATPHGGLVYLGNYSASAYDVFTYQTKSGLPNGYYTLKAWVWRVGSQTTCRMEASGFGGTTMTMPINAGTGWTQITISGINVTNGTCTFGFRSVSPGGASLKIDDVEFYKP